MKLFIIAGVTAPWDEREIEETIDSLTAKLQDDKKEKAEKLKAWLKTATDEVGDSLVTVDSALLQGVPHEIVHGTHLSIIRNISRDSRRTPPGVPIILKLLEEGGGGL
ncbi:MAG: hypothetical protein GY859_18150 [Desulfobacterales bacterium]|nr:hypothetical protein [Desulfobacterales bacterium]